MRAIALTALITAALGAGASADQVIMLKGNPVSDVKVTSWTYEEVVCQTGSGGGATLKFKTSKVKDVEFDSQPGAYREGKEAYAKGNWEKAGAEFQDVIKNTKNKANSLFYQFSAYYLGDCYFQLRAYADAKDTLNELVKVAPKARFLPQALVLLGRIAMIEGKLDEARKPFEQLLKLAQTVEGLDKRYLYLAQVWLGRAELQAGNLDKAKDYFSKVKSRGRAFPGEAKKALVGYAICQLQDKKYREARRDFEKFIEQSDLYRDGYELAQAYNGIGTSYYAEKDYENALRAFLRVIVLFDRETGEQPKALYHAYKCFEILAPGNSEYGLRAKQLRSELRSRFSQSTWAKR